MKNEEEPYLPFQNKRQRQRQFNLRSLINDTTEHHEKISN